MFFSLSFPCPFGFLAWMTWKQKNWVSLPVGHAWYMALLIISQQAANYWRTRIHSFTLSTSCTSWASPSSRESVNSKNSTPWQSIDLVRPRTTECYFVQVVCEAPLRHRHIRTVLQSAAALRLICLLPWPWRTQFEDSTWTEIVVGAQVLRVGFGNGCRLIPNTTPQ